MNDKRRVGRPKGPEKVVFKKYVEPKDKEILEKFGVGGFLMWCHDHMDGGAVPQGMGDCVRAEWVQTSPKEENLRALEDHAKRVMQPLLDEQLKVEREKYKKEVMALLEDCEKLTQDRDYWKGRFESTPFSEPDTSDDLVVEELRRKMSLMEKKIKEYETMLNGS